MRAPEFELDYRRLQIHEQQAERQRRNPLQKALVFSQRAKELISMVPWPQSGCHVVPRTLFIDRY